MNFLPVTVADRMAKATGFEVTLPKAASTARGFLGIRPEDFVQSASDNGAWVELKVEVREVLGADQYLYGKVGADDVTARVDPQLNVSVGDRVRLGINMRRLHLFDAETEKALL